MRVSAFLFLATLYPFSTESVAIAAQVSAQSSQRDAILTADKFAECIIGRRRGLARKFVIDDVHGLKGMYSKLLDTSCVSISSSTKKEIDYLKFPGHTLHDALANALVRAELSASGPSTFEHVPVEPAGKIYEMPASEFDKLSTKERAAYTSWRERAVAETFLFGLADCTSRRSPEMVRKLALTKPEGHEERLALDHLLADVQACVPAGTTFKIRRNELRGPLVREYYRLAIKAKFNSPQTLKAQH